MSTRITNAYISKEKTSLAQFFNKVEQLKKEIYEAQLKKINKDFIRLALDIYDFHQYRPKAFILDKNQNLTCSINEVNLKNIVLSQMEKKEKSDRNSFLLSVYDFQIRVTLLDNNLYFRIHTLNNPEFEEIFKNIFDVKDYSFQNGSGRPDHISEKDWAEREYNWDRVFESRSNFLIDCHINIAKEIYVNQYELSVPNEMIADKSRFKDLAERLYFKQSKKEIKQPQDYIRTISSEEYKNFIKDTIDNLKESLKLKIDIGELTSFSVKIKKELEPNDDIFDALLEPLFI